jgi:regulator of RNase E activity RraA
VPLDVDGTRVEPGDLVVCDVDNGVVVIPRELVAKVVEALPALVEADHRVRTAVAKGEPVSQAFKAHRDGASRVQQTRGKESGPAA